jgi:hypothetical protein
MAIIRLINEEMLDVKENGEEVAGKIRRERRNHLDLFRSSGETSDLPRSASSRVAPV